MGYQRERDQFIAAATAEGLRLDVCYYLLRYATTLQRLSEAQCNGDWPFNGDRDRPYRPLGGGLVESDESINKRRERWDKQYTECPKCQASGVAKSAMRYSSKLAPNYEGDPQSPIKQKVCPDCRIQELASKLLAGSSFAPVFNGDPRGAVLVISTPNYPYKDDGSNGARGLYVPARATKCV